jgi:NAD(P)-dependent dehydrogenase (short-subunit alcohol dehydrogenase family)
MTNDSLSNLFSLEGRVVVLTGGAGFLGQQYARALKKAGAQVVVFDQSEALSRLVEGEYTYYPVDITAPKEVERAVKGVISFYGQIDSLVNNAAMNPAVGDPNSAKMGGPYEDYPTDLWRQELEVNMTGMHLCIRAVAPYMMEARRGSIVNIASEVSVIAYDWTGVYEAGKYKSPAYIASKHGVLGITRSWAAYLAPHGVRVNSFSPGGMQKENMPLEFVEAYSKKNMLGSMAQEGDYNGHIIFLCSDASRRMTGQNLIADGGRSAW